jgi:quercetin dioxygenase-like cupin family protein
VSDVVEWRPGVTTRLLAAASTGSAQLCVMEQWSAPGTGAPAHVHPGVEEAIVVLAGEAEVWIEASERRLGAGESVLVPAGARHGFVNAGAATLHTLAVFPSPSPPVRYDAEPDVVYEIGGTGPARRDAHRSIRRG